MPKLVSMKRTAAEAKRERTLQSPTKADVPQYPYGLSIQLEDESLQKLGVEDLPQVGQTRRLVARVEVTAVSQQDHKRDAGGPRRSLTLQITDLALAQDEDLTARRARSLYGKQPS